MKRRSVLLLLGATALAPLAACAVNTVNGVTTVTVNVATLDAYAQAAKNAATLLLPVFAGQLGVAGEAAVSAGIAAVTGDIAALDKANSGSASFSFALGSAPAALSALQKDVAALFADFSTVAGANGSSVPNSVQTDYTAFETVVDLLSAIGTNTVGAVKPPMSEAAALIALGVKPPA